MEKVEDKCGDPCEVKGQIDGEDQKGRRKQEDEEICGGMCPGCHRGEEVTNSIWIWSEEIEI